LINLPDEEARENLIKYFLPEDKTDQLDYGSFAAQLEVIQPIYPIKLIIHIELFRK